MGDNTLLALSTCANCKLGDLLRLKLLVSPCDATRLPANQGAGHTAAPENVQVGGQRRKAISEPCVGEKKGSAVSPHSTAKKAVILGSWMYHAFG